MVFSIAEQRFGGFFSNILRNSREILKNSGGRILLLLALVCVWLAHQPSHIALADGVAGAPESGDANQAGRAGRAAQVGHAATQTGKAEATAGKSSAAHIVEQALAVMGGPGVTERVHIIKTDEHRLTYHLADSEHSLPPYIPDYGSITQWVDISVPALRGESTTAAATGDKSTFEQISREGFSVVRSTFNGKTSGQRVGLESTRWALQNPLLVLLNAAKRSDLRALAPESLFGIEHQRIVFEERGNRVTLWINSLNNHLDAVDIFGSDSRDIFWHEWGDVTLRSVFSDWHYEAGQLHYPHQVNIFFNGELQETHSIDHLSVNPDMANVDMTVPKEGRPTDPERSKIDTIPLGRPDRPIAEVAPGIVQIPGSWYVTLVRQPDGLVVIDAPISNGYSAKVMEEAEKRFPGVKIKAVIATTNFWWHIAGLREYAARGIPVWVPEQNVALVRRLLTSPHTLEPDALQKSGIKPTVVGISSMRSVGSGDTRMALYPVRTATAQMLMSFFPELKMLHTAEMAQPLGPNGSFLFPESLLELQRAVEANGLQVTSVIGMHMSPTPWSKIEEALAAAAEHGES
ncbi:MAG TPA: hypothetical protein VGI16_03370 [Candidatus Acidoferrum sp.]